MLQPWPGIGISRSAETCALTCRADLSIAKPASLVFWLYLIWFDRWTAWHKLELLKFLGRHPAVKFAPRIKSRLRNGSEGFGWLRLGSVVISAVERDNRTTGPRT